MNLLHCPECKTVDGGAAPVFPSNTGQSCFWVLNESSFVETDDARKKLYICKCFIPYFLINYIFLPLYVRNILRISLPKRNICNKTFFNINRFLLHKYVNKIFLEKRYVHRLDKFYICSEYVKYILISML